MHRWLRILGVMGIAWIVFAGHRAQAFPSYARKTKAACAACHQSVAGGAELTDAGKAFKADAAKIPAGAVTGAEYVGMGKCKSCHYKQYKAWQDTKHSHAWEGLSKGDTAMVNALAAKLKVTVAGAPNKTDGCITCHVTGFQLAGGYPAPDSAKTANSMNVTCESCHGPGSVHVTMKTPEDRKKSINRNVGEKLCMNCHTPDTSPKFKFAEYKPRGVHAVAAAPAPTETK